MPAIDRLLRLLGLPSALTSTAYDGDVLAAPWAGDAEVERARSERVLRPHRPAYRRLQASVLCRPAGLRPFAPADGERAADPPGIRIYSDEPFAIGERWKLEIMLRTAAPRSFIVEVAWVDRLADDPDARYDVGLTIEAIAPSTSALLMSLLADD